MDITSDSQVNSNFPYRWSTASLTFYNYFYLFLYNENNHKLQHATSKITTEPTRKSCLRTASNAITRGRLGLELVCGRPTLALGSALVYQTKQLWTTKKKPKRIKHKQKAKRAAGIEGQVATMLISHTVQIDTTDITAMKRARKNEKEQLKGDKTEVPPWEGQR